VQASEWIGALRERNFRRFFIGQTASGIGSAMAPIAITFAVLEHGGPTQLGYVSAAGLVPVLVLLLVGGVISDRLSRRVVMLTSDVLRTVAEAGLGVWILIERPPLWGFMALAACVGAGQAFFSPAMTGLMPQVVSAARLQQANALMNVSGSGAQIIGPAIAGGIIVVANPGWAVVIDGISYGVSVASLALVRIDWVASASMDSFLAQLRHGWREFWSRTWLSAIVVEFSLLNVVLFAPLFVLGPVVAKASLGGAPAWSLVLACQAGGAVLGGIAMLRWHPRRPLLVATIAPLTMAWPLLALAVVAPLGVVASGGFVAGIGIAVFGTLWNTTMQREVPHDVLSRVSAYDWFGSLAFLPIGLAIIGPVSHAIGVATTFEWATACTVVLIALTLSVTRMRAPALSPDGDSARAAT
jgi:hypothetical protein